jgi:NitT/TauT family transport system substrate-binding protein
MFAHGGQPQAMLAYTLHLKGIDISAIRGIDAGGPDAAMAAFAAGEGDYFHEQAPYPQQLECDGHTHIVASVGDVIGPVAFSSLAATPAWLARPEAKRFLSAYGRSRQWTHTALPAEVAAAVQPFFPGIRREALANAIAYYQRLRCWEGGMPIERSEYETALDVFAHSGLITRRHAYEQVVVAPPL